MSEIKNKIFRNLYWAVLGKVVTLLGSLLVGIMVARYLGPEQYGLMNYVISYVSLFQIFASFGLDNIEIRELSKSNADKSVILGTAFRIRFVLALITVVLIVVTAAIFEADHFTFLMIALYSLSVILNRFAIIRNYFTSIVWNEYIVKTEITRTVLGAVIKIVLLLLNAPLWMFIAAMVFDVFLLSMGYVMSYCTKIGPMSLWSFDRDLAKYLLKQSFPMLLSGAAIVVYQRIDQVMIGNMMNKYYVGQFSVAVRLSEVLLFVPTILSQTITPILVRFFEKDKEEYIQKAQQFMNITVWSCVFISFLLSFTAYWVVKFTFGIEYISAVSALQIMSYKCIFMALFVVSGQMIIIQGLQRYAVLRNVLGAVVCITLNLVLIPEYGINGASFAALFATLVSGLLAHLFIPSYRFLIPMQIRSLIVGWKDIVYIKHLFR